MNTKNVHLNDKNIAKCNILYKLLSKALISKKI